MIHLYARVSTAEQAADGSTSIEEQLRKGRAIAQLRSAGPYDIATYEDRGVSGSIPLAQRPAGKDLITTAQKSDTVVASKLDRLFRSATDALSTADQFKARGIDLILIDMGSDPVTSNGTAKLFFGMLSLVAEFERDRINERTNDGRRAKRQNGGHVGGSAPYGFRVEGKGKTARLVRDEAEQKTIARVVELSQKWSPALVVRALKQEGYETRDGWPFEHVQVKRIRERHAGAS